VEGVKNLVMTTKFPPQMYFMEMLFLEAGIPALPVAPIASPDEPYWQEHACSRMGFRYLNLEDSL